MPLWAASDSPYAQFHANQGKILAINELLMCVMIFISPTLLFDENKIKKIWTNDVIVNGISTMISIIAIIPFIENTFHFITTLGGNYNVKFSITSH